MKKIEMLDLAAEYQYMKKDIDAAIEKAMAHQTWILGPEVKELEEKIASYLKIQHCIGVASGTDALVIALRAMAIKNKGKEYFERSDEIITTPFTFTATGDAILRAGATPVFVDIDPTTFNLDTGKTNTYLKNNRSKVKGLIPVHLYGRSCSMNDILGIAQESGLFVVEDVAQAFGAEWQKRKLGSIGHAGALSFFPSKNLGCFGDGGAVTTNDAEIAELARQLMKHGGRDKYNVEHIGYNSRLDTIQAAILTAKIKYLDEMNNKRIKNARTYIDCLRTVGSISLPEEAADSKHVFHQFTIRVKNAARDAMQEYLKKNGISTMVYYPFPLHKMKVFAGRGINAGTLHEAEKACSEVLSLPIEPLMNEEDAVYISDIIKGFNG